MSSALNALVGRSLPTPAHVDGGSFPIRSDRYGGGMVAYSADSLMALCEEGTIILATSPVVSTGALNVAAQTSYQDTGPNFYVLNNEAAGGKNLHLLSIKLISTLAMTAATAIHYAGNIDTVARQITTNHVASATQVCPYSSAAVASSPTVQYQNSATASVFGASSGGSRIVSRGVLGGLNIPGDVLQVVFGATQLGASSTTTAVEGAGQPGTRVVSDAPVILAPGHCYSFQIWGPSSSQGINPEFQILMVAR